jgi:uncharacterized protein
MPRKLFKRFMPDPDFIKNHRSLQLINKWLHDPNLWHLNRYAVSMAVFLGLFTAFIPLPSQMLIAALLAIWWRANLPISIALVWLTNPLTMPPIFYITYHIGAWVLKTPHSNVKFEPSVEWFGSQLAQIWEPFLLGSLICGLLLGLLGAMLVRILWRVHVTLRWRARQRCRSADK